MSDLTRIIVVEDALFIKEALWQIFSKTEVDILCFPSSGTELMLKVKELKPDIVLMDIVLPNENGITLIKKIQSLDPEVRIIAMSSLGDEPIVIDAFKAGVHDFIKKPFTSDEILSAIREVAGQKQTGFQKIAA